MEYKNFLIDRKTPVLISEGTPKRVKIAQNHIGFRQNRVLGETKRKKERPRQRRRIKKCLRQIFYNLRGKYLDRRRRSRYCLRPDPASLSSFLFSLESIHSPKKKNSSKNLLKGRMDSLVKSVEALRLPRSYQPQLYHNSQAQTTSEYHYMTTILVSYLLLHIWLPLVCNQFCIIVEHHTLC